MFKKAPNIKTQEKIAKLDKHWNEGTPPKTNEIYTDGRFVAVSYTHLTLPTNREV